MENKKGSGKWDVEEGKVAKKMGENMNEFLVQKTNGGIFGFENEIIVNRKKAI